MFTVKTFVTYKSNKMILLITRKDKIRTINMASVNNDKEDTRREKNKTNKYIDNCEDKKPKNIDKDNLGCPLAYKDLFINAKQNKESILQIMNYIRDTSIALYNDHLDYLQNK